MFDDAYLPKVVDDKESGFTRMEVRNLIYHQFFSTANSSGHQPTTPQYFQPLTLQTLVIHWVLSEYASGEKATVMFSQDSYRGAFCPLPVIHFPPDATVPINNPLVGCLIRPAAQLCCNRHSSLPVGAPQPRWTLFHFIPHSLSPVPRSSARHRSSSFPTGTPRSGLSLTY